MKRDRIKYRVAPLSNLGRFPFDMLRYDGAFPSTQTDSAAIESSTWEPYSAQSASHRLRR